MKFRCADLEVSSNKGIVIPMCSCVWVSCIQSGRCTFVELGFNGLKIAM